MQTGIPYSHAKTSAARYSNYLIVLLGILTAFGPLVTDMYLPTLPSMTVYFGTSQSMVQMGLTASMAGLALGQLLFGPLSDKFGRRPLLLVSLLLFVASTVICIFSPTIYVFVGMRLFQGIGAAGGIVISRSVATDRYRGKELVKVLAVIGVINGIAPVAAPVLGGVLTDAVGWRGIFVILLAIGVILSWSGAFGINLYNTIGVILLGGSMLFRESLPPRRRARQSLLRTFGNFGTILRNKRFMLYVFQLGFAQGILFSNIASSPFIIQEHYGFSALAFSIVFAVNSLAFMAAAPLSLRFRRPQDGIMASCIGMCVLSVAELAALWCRCSFWVYEGILFLLLFTMALTFTLSTTLAMESERRYAGSASAILGAVCFAFGGIVSPIVGTATFSRPPASSSSYAPPHRSAAQSRQTGSIRPHRVPEPRAALRWEKRERGPEDTPSFPSSGPRGVSPTDRKTEDTVTPHAPTRPSLSAPRPTG